MTVPASIGFAAAFASAVLFAGPSPAVAAQDDGASSVRRCILEDGRLPEGGSASLEISKSFAEDGRSHGLNVRWLDNQGGAVRLLQPGDRAAVELRWPDEHKRARPGEPFDWAQGSVTIHFGTSEGANIRRLPGEEWSKVVVDRNESLLVTERDGMRILLLPETDLHLASGLGPSTTPGRLSMPLDALIAWGSGARRITVYETRVTRRKRARNDAVTSPLGRIRIVGAYDLDIDALARAAAQVREATQRWEEEVSGNWRQCEIEVDLGHIVPTDAGARRR